MDIALIEAFLDRLDAFGPDRVTILLDPIITNMSESESFGNAGLRAMADLARQRGIRMVNARSVLAEEQRRTGLALVVGPHDGHWNVFANCIIARELRSVLLPDSGRLDQSDCQTRAATRWAEGLN